MSETSKRMAEWRRRAETIALNVFGLWTDPEIPADKKDDFNLIVSSVLAVMELIRRETAEEAAHIVADAHRAVDLRWNRGGERLQYAEYAVWALATPQRCLDLGHYPKPGAFCPECIPGWARTDRNAGGGGR